MSTAHIDHVSTLEASTRFGVIQHIVRRIRVTGLESTDYTVLMSALAAAGVPAAGARLGSAANVVVKEHNIKLVDEDKGTVDVDVIYGLISDEGQSIDVPPYGILVGKLSTSLSQVTTNKDRDGNTIVVQHTYPAGDTAFDDNGKEIIVGADPDYPGETVTQGGEVQYLQPQRTLTYRGIKTTLFPWLLANALIGKVNSSAFAGGAEASWLCTTCSWEICDGGAPNRYYFTFEFQFNPDGWQPTIIFKDPRTNQPPSLLVQGKDIKTVNVYDEVDFEAAIGVRVQGG